MEVYIILFCIIAYIMIVFLYGTREKKKQKLLLISRLRKEFGTFAIKDICLSDSPNINRFYEKLRKKTGNDEVYVDDITWNDLDFDIIYEMINISNSSAGDEYLYYLLRKLEFDGSVIESNNKIIEFFQFNSEIRLKIQEIFSILGKSGKYSIVDYLDSLSSIKNRKLSEFIIGFIAMALGVIVMAYSGIVGIIILICTICYQVIRYFSIKAEIEPYYVCFSYLNRLVNASRRITSIECSDLADIQNEIIVVLDRMKNFEKRANNLPNAMANMTMNPLEIMADYINMIFHFDLIAFYKLVRLIASNKEGINELVLKVGKLESFISIASFREALPYYSLPEFAEDNVVDNEELYHPLLANPVANSITTDKPVLITGSNASGKSTFLKSVAINAILAQTIGTCLTKRTRTSFFETYSSLAIKDNIIDGDSYYLAEIKSIKRILDASKNNEHPVLCFVDEVLRGTNAIERIAASTQILKALSKENIICFAATHDVELTRLLHGEYINYHFKEVVLENDIEFDYKLNIGAATSRNAIKLLQILGYDEDITEKAYQLAEIFENTGHWE